LKLDDTYEARISLTRALLDPIRVAFTLSKSELMHLRKWSDGFLIDGQGKPACAKN